MLRRDQFSYIDQDIDSVTMTLLRSLPARGTVIQAQYFFYLA